MEFVDVGVELAMLCLLRKALVESEGDPCFPPEERLLRDEDIDNTECMLEGVNIEVVLDDIRAFRCLEAAVEMSSGSSSPATLLCSTDKNCSRCS